MTYAIFLTVPGIEIWFSPELQLSLKLECISGLQSDHTHTHTHPPKRKKTPNNPKFLMFKTFFHMVLEKLLFTSCRANGRSLEGPQSENKMHSEGT